MINLYFTEKEMSDFLIKQGYTIQSIKTWKSYNTYHNQVENSYLTIDVAVKGDLDEYNDIEGAYRHDSVDKYKINSVFAKEIKSKLLEL
jgi:hypothetical protein